MMKSPVIDAHHHFWDPTSGGDYAWLSGPFEPINRRFDPADLQPSLQAAGVTGTVLVQTWNDPGETWELLQTAAETDFVRGVVGWVDLTDPSVNEALSELTTSDHGRFLVGVRHLIQTEPDPRWLLRDDVRRGLRAVQQANLVYDFVPNLPQLPACLETATAFPELRFVLDHMSKPNIRGREFSEWAAPMRGFRAEREHVWCKLSGLVTEADWCNWRPADLRPYVDEVLDIFGPDRCMFGTDWPVCLVAASYERVKDALNECLSGLNERERQGIFGRTAVKAYRLTLPP